MMNKGYNGEDIQFTTDTLRQNPSIPQPKRRGKVHGSNKLDNKPRNAFA